MSPKDFRRARTADAIEARRLALLQAARDLLEEHDPSDISLAAICGKAGLVKSAVYRYFESREDILAEVLLLDLNQFQRDFADGLSGVAANDLKEIARIYAKMVAERPRMAVLITQMATILERNISSARLLDVKQQMLGILGAAVAVVAKAAPAFGDQKALEATRLMYSQTSAFYPGTNPDQKMADVLARPEFEVFRTDFQSELEKACRAILLGISSDAY